MKSLLQKFLNLFKRACCCIEECCEACCACCKCVSCEGC